MKNKNNQQSQQVKQEQQSSDCGQNRNNLTVSLQRQVKTCRCTAFSLPI